MGLLFDVMRKLIELITEQAWCASVEGSVNRQNLFAANRRLLAVNSGLAAPDMRSSKFQRSSSTTRNNRSGEKRIGQTCGLENTDATTKKQLRLWPGVAAAAITRPSTAGPK